MASWRDKIGKERKYNKYFDDRDDVVTWDVLSVEEIQELELEFISINSKYVQGVRIAIDQGDGHLEINAIQAKQMELWEDTMPSNKVHIKCLSSAKKISVYNIFKDENGVRHSRTDFMGMLIEDEGNVRIYRCNEGHVDCKNDFDKFVFKITKL